MKRHVFNLSVPESIYTVIKEHKKHRLPTKSFFLEAFLIEIDKACDGDPQKVADMLRQIFLNGMKLKIAEGEIKAICPSPSTEGNSPVRDNNTTQKAEENVKEKAKKIQEMYDF